MHIFILEIYKPRNSIFSGSVAETDSLFNSFDSLSA